jgi:predicted nucleic acid-binding protein
LIVVDASIVLAFIMDDETAPYADAAVVELTHSGALVPTNFYSEVAHALLQAERRGRIKESASNAALREILALPLTTGMPDVREAMRLAREHRLTCYDAFYLALAVESGSPLATVDATLTAAARAGRVYWLPGSGAG